MVLTEAFAAGTPVVASDIAGYRDVVRDGIDGVLVPRGDAQALAEVLRDLWDEPERRAAMARNAARDVERFAWPHVAAEVMEAYRDAIAVPRAGTPRSAARSGSGCARPTSSRMCPLAGCPAWSRSPPTAVTIPRWRCCAGSGSPRCRWAGSCSPFSRSTRSAWTTSPAR